VTFNAGGGGAGNPTAQNPITVANGECRIAGLDNGDATQSKGDFFHVSENAAADPANTTQTLTSCVDLSGPTPCANFANNYFINNVHGVTLTYTNVFTPPPPPDICTYTKGWYQNKNGEPTIIAGIDGRSIADQIKIFNASPGQPGDVQWGVLGGSLNNKPNSLLNLYQQLLAALNNLGGNATAGPPAVDAAIAAALAATSGTGTTIRVVDGTDIGGLTSVLSSFNEGLLAGFPHCGDEILQ
jgi:hypothetical protein